MSVQTKLKMQVIGLYLAILLTIACLSAAIERRLTNSQGGSTSSGMTCNAETKFFTQQVDHLGFKNNDTFQQRYMYSDKSWNHNNGPIFFYTGNEGDVIMYCNNTGFMWEQAVRFDAMIVFAEHRYYGQSMPYGNMSYADPSHLNYLTVEQALADYALLITYLKSSIKGAAHSPVIVMGGSYGGMLSAWMRLKYPNVIIGALAASAPIYMLPGMTPCNSFTVAATKTFEVTSPMCVTNIKQSWATIDTVAQTAAGKIFISSAMKLCKSLQTQADIDDLKNWLLAVWGNLAMMDYPYPATYLEPLPAWPVAKACQPLSTAVYKDRELILHLDDAVNVYFNYTGDQLCLNTSQQDMSANGDAGWYYQACTEIIGPSCSGGVNDMFAPSTWDYKAYAEYCNKLFGIWPRQYWIGLQYWGAAVNLSSNIIFSNGLLDPWHAQGVLESLSDTLTAVILPLGAHHADLRGTDPADPPEFKAARQRIANIFELWVNDYWKSKM